MPGKFLNNPRATPKGADAVTAALNLLASWGGGSSDLHDLLKETRSAISHNERLISDSQVVVERAKEIQRHEERLAVREAEVGQKWAKLEELRKGLDEFEKEHERHWPNTA